MEEQQRRQQESEGTIELRGQQSGQQAESLLHCQVENGRPQTEHKAPKKKGKKHRGVPATVLLLLIGILIGSAATIIAIKSSGSVVAVNKADYDKLAYMGSKYQKAEMLYKTIEGQYYGDFTDEELMTGMYKGLFSALDKYSSYMTADEYEAMVASSTGAFSGIGVVMSITDEDNIIVISTIDGAPAQKAGMKPGDIIIEVDGESYAGSQLDVAATKLRGEAGSKVEVTFLQDGVRKEVTLVRRDIVTESVYSSMVEGENIGYIRITAFELATADDFAEALRDMEVKDVEGIIIDIRSNGGGIVDSGIDIADMLLPEATIISTKTKAGEEQYYNSDAKATNLPYVLLVDGMTASTSEILAVAIKENKGGKIIGNTTFGKGVVQQMGSIDKSGDAIKLTFEEYFGPNNVKINGVGIKPDYEVDYPKDPADTTDYQLEKAIEVLKNGK